MDLWLTQASSALLLRQEQRIFCYKTSVNQTTYGLCSDASNRRLREQGIGRQPLISPSYSQTKDLQKLAYSTTIKCVILVLLIHVCLHLVNPVITTWCQEWQMRKNLTKFELQIEPEVEN